MENRDPLVTTDWLADHLEDDNLRVVDIRGYVKKTDLGGGRQRADYLAAREEYDEAHVPGAVYVDWTSDITDPDDPVPAQVAPPERFAGLMGSLGIGEGTHVVVYTTPAASSRPAMVGAHLYGHDRVSVLDGGWKKWTLEVRPTTTRVPEPKPAVFTPEPRVRWRTEAEALLAASEGGDAFVLDARDEGQYTGAVARGEGRAGRVPGAVHPTLTASSTPMAAPFGPARSSSGGSGGRSPEDKDEPVVAYCNCVGRRHGPALRFAPALLQEAANLRRLVERRGSREICPQNSR